MKDNNLSYAIGGEAAKGSHKYSGNQYQTTNPNAMINKGRGPTVGNKSNDSTPGSHGMPSHNAGKETTMGCHHPQVRNPSGTKEMPNRGKETFNYGRGPTKGNA